MLIDRFMSEVNRMFAVVNSQLADREFLAGQYSIADMSGFPWMRRHGKIDIDLGPFPNINRWIETIENRPAVQRGMVAPCGAPL